MAAAVAAEVDLAEAAASTAADTAPVLAAFITILPIITTHITVLSLAVFIPADIITAAAAASAF